VVVLLYLTDRWPFHPGESFLTREIRDLAPHFEKILLLPLAENIDRERPPRKYPENVEVLTKLRDEIWGIWGTRGSISRLMGGLSRPLVCTKESLISKPFKPRNIIGEVAQVKLICDQIMKNVDMKNVDACASFWLNRGASVCAELKRRNQHLVAFSRGHGGDIYSERQNMKHLPLQSTTLKNLDGILPDSEAGVDYLVNKFPSKKDNIFVGRLGVDNGDVVEGSTDGMLRLLSVSTLVPVKRVHLIPDGLKMCTRKVIWTHIGGGECLDIVKQSMVGLDNNVEINLLGQLPHQDVLEYYQNNPIDLFINVSSSEGLPVSIMEAFANGIPVIATSVGGCPEIVTNDCGFILQPNFSAIELAKIIDEYDLDSSKMRTAALEKQRNEYSSKKNQAAFAKTIIAKINQKR
jgi:glycosyltransferase involved in cell wall biosynthesis